MSEKKSGEVVTIEWPEEEMIAIALPEKYWVVILAALDQIIPAVMSRVNEIRELGFDHRSALERLSPEEKTAFAAPLIARGVIVDALVEKGGMTAEAGETYGTAALGEIVAHFKQET